MADVEQKKTPDQEAGAGVERSEKETELADVSIPDRTKPMGGHDGNYERFVSAERGSGKLYILSLIKDDSHGGWTDWIPFGVSHAWRMYYKQFDTLELALDAISEWNHADLGCNYDDFFIVQAVADVKAGTRRKADAPPFSLRSKKLTSADSDNQSDHPSQN